MPKGVFVRGGRFYYRRTVPMDVQQALGRTEIWRSLRTDSPTKAARRTSAVAACLDAEIELARSLAGLPFDPTLLRPSEDDPAIMSQSISGDAWNPVRRIHFPKLGEAYSAYMADPTHAWSARTRDAYETTRRLAVSVIGAKTPMCRLSRASLRDFIDVLRFLPRNAAKLFPRLTPREASERSRTRMDIEAMSAANVNVCLGNLSTFLNWAVNEELLVRNPARGLRLPDSVAKRDKRLPFSADQLRAIFNAPLYRGCADGERGYARPGSSRPQNARWWVPLIGLCSGMRLGEITQLDAADIRMIDGVRCFVVSDVSLAGSTDKVLKTGISERAIPIHVNLLKCGLLDFVEEQRAKGAIKLFEDIDPGTRGVRAVAFSKWFTQFLRSCGAYRERTSFHSFRHNFRDELRAARIDHDVAMALGGWTRGAVGQREASDNYGSGHKIKVLAEAIDRMPFREVDLSHLIR